MTSRRIISGAIVAVALLAGDPAWASSASTRLTTLLSLPGWVAAPQVAFDCQYSFLRCYQLQHGIGHPSLFLSTTRNSIGTAPDASGNYYQFTSNVPRITTAGVTVEESRTNDALWSRNMTNAAWTKVGLGAALNATGIDGTANSATTLTATGTGGVCTSSCTALQTITLGSTADTYSVFLKRVTGGGAVNITINNLVGTTACTLVTTGFTRCSVTATLANPVIGVQLTAVNDVVIADFNQMESGGFATTPIPTTNATVARAADGVTAKNFPAGTLTSQGTIYEQFVFEGSSSAFGIFPALAGANANTDIVSLGLTNGNTSGISFFSIVADSSKGSVNINPGSILPGPSYKIAGSYGSGTIIGGMSGKTSTSSLTGIPALSQLILNGTGHFQTPVSRIIQRDSIIPTPLTAGTLQQITTGTNP